jgi:hypothetical protein
MAVSRALRRLLFIRDLEEEQRRLALEAALGERTRLEDALAAAAERERRGRRLVQASARTGELLDRLVGLEESRAAGRHARFIEPRIEAVGEEVAARREEFLLKRVERRQAETLIRETEAREAIEAGRRGQQALDDWYSSRLYREAIEAEPRPRTAAERGSRTPDVSEGFS